MSTCQYRILQNEKNRLTSWNLGARNYIAKREIVDWNEIWWDWLKRLWFPMPSFKVVCSDWKNSRDWIVTFPRSKCLTCRTDGKNPHRRRMNDLEWMGHRKNTSKRSIYSKWLFGFESRESLFFIGQFFFEPRNLCFSIFKLLRYLFLDTFKDEWKISVTQKFEEWF